MFRCHHHCDRDDFATQLDAIQHQLAANYQQGEKIMGALENLQAADLAEEGELETFLTDIAGALDGHSDPAIQAVADSINARVAKMQAADPAVPVVTDPTPVDPGTGDSGDAAVSDTPAE